jgi:ribosomal protein S3AE
VFLFDGLGPLMYFRRAAERQGTETIEQDEDIETRERMILETQTMYSTLGVTRYESQNYTIGGAKSASKELIRQNLVVVERSTLEESDSCAVCLSDMKEDDENKIVRLVNCKHLFHEQCIRDWLIRDNSCPLCKTPLTEQD